jgi:beta-glucosidase
VIQRSAARTAALVVVLSVVGCATPVPQSAAPSASPSGPVAAVPPTLTDWRDPGQAPSARAEALIADMTLDEKIGQMTQLEQGSVQPQGVADLFLGSVLSGGGGSPAQNDPGGWWRMVDGFQAAALSTRLAIPILYGVDAVHGHGNVHGATVFPHDIGLGANGDPALVEQIGAATAAEMVATGIRWDFAPVVAVPQDVRWGRTYEGFGEDPGLVGELGAAFIRGLQGDDLSAPTAVAATPKHFVGDGGTGWGTSTTNGYQIDQGVTVVDEATLDAIHLAPYRDAIAAGARIVMASFSSTNAGKVHGDRHLVTDVLKGDLGFTGFVVSDWAGVDQVDPDYTAAVAQSISAGIDMVMVPSDGVRFQDAVRVGLTAGTIDPERVDDAVRRILTVKFEMGLFETPMPPAPPDANVVGTAAHRALARDAVARSAVLLKTTAGVLPVAGEAGLGVLLTGSGAHDIGRQSGGWTMTWQGSDGPITPGTTVLDELTARLGDRVQRIEFPEGSNPVAGAPIGIAVVSEPPYAEGVGDSATLALPEADLAAVAALRLRVETLIVVVLSGRPVMLDEILPVADVVIAGWLPGTEGSGIVDLLFGDEPFTATTPVTWPRTPGDAARTGQGPCDGAVFPVGYGLDATGRLLGPAACP